MGFSGVVMGPTSPYWYTVGVPEHLWPKIDVQGDKAYLTVKTIDDQVVKLKASANLTGNDGKVWMLEEKWDWVQSLVDRKDYRRAKRHAVGEAARGTWILAGYTLEEADILAASEYMETREQQEAADRAVTLESLKKRSLDLAVKNSAGEGLVMIGSVVALFPGYGTIIGGAMVVGGIALTAAQKHELAKRTAYRRKRDLIAARTAFIKGEITEAQYLEIQRRILEEAGNELAAAEGENLGRLLVPDPSYISSLTVEAKTGIMDRVVAFGKEIVANPVLGLAVFGLGLLGGYAMWAAYEEVASWRRT